jgi:cytochrome c553
MAFAFMSSRNCKEACGHSLPRLYVHIVRTQSPIVLLIPILVSLAKADDLVDDPNYKARCKVCHGANAEGKAQKKIPALKTWADRSEAELAKAIEEGNPTTTPKMPRLKRS